MMHALIVYRQFVEHLSDWMILSQKDQRNNAVLGDTLVEQWKENEIRSITFLFQ